MGDAAGNVQSLRDAGFAWVRQLADPQLVAQLCSALQAHDDASRPASRAGVPYAARNLLGVPAVAAFASGDLVQNALRAMVAAAGMPVRAILFDKLADANWGVGWHQDLMIPVRERVETPDFSAWSVKQGVPHVKPPEEVLRQMVTIRLHLDDAGEDNGPLQVVPCSHHWGEVPTPEVAERVRGCEVTLCTAAAGDALFMRPLLMHASAKATTPARRRVLHIEFAAQPLPGELRWPLYPRLSEPGD
ncbi:Phytanoyl-CoA dioxygenase (PhyH) [Posidoniimonas polymericola]|uniref:Phytanoyl-CoA dioxygenase (PhyH) n=1 Tax=Posidoniimonas polymericola TaxID=2528002 RepID=A0A5C5YTC7_9BACT|nr:phytanoyl-CoA dioxygenase family protein [Posidoniimonas polymericola]TWT78254.1 Phytanoyl-CoA dioxygenase (PhyH) [Posidoniimonas polymericola]